MRFSLKLTAKLTKYNEGRRVNGERNYPPVMMLEPPTPASENGSFNSL